LGTRVGARVGLGVGVGVGVGVRVGLGVRMGVGVRVGTRLGMGVGVGGSASAVGWLPAEDSPVKDDGVLEDASGCAAAVFVASAFTICAVGLVPFGEEAFPSLLPPCSERISRMPIAARATPATTRLQAGKRAGPATMRLCAGAPASSLAESAEVDRPGCSTPSGASPSTLRSSSLMMSSILPQIT